MGNKILYTVAIAADELTDASQRVARNVSSAGSITDGPTAVESISLEPGEFPLTAQLRGDSAERRAAVLEELFDAQNISEVAFYDANGSNADGYYALENTTVEPVDPRSLEVEQFDGVLKRKGTRNSYYRAIEAKGNNQVDHDEAWGNDEEALIALSESSRKVRWFGKAGDSEPAQAVETRTGRYGDLEIYDVADWPFSESENATLIYDLAYDQEGRSDVELWEACTEDKYEEGILQWFRIFRTDHDFDCELVFENSLLRLRLDEDAGTTTAEEWDDGTDDWTEITLGDPGDWSVLDADLTHIGMVRVDAQLTLEHPTEGLFALNASMQRGAEDVLFSIPPNQQGPIPTGIVDWLEPIAASTIVDPAPTKTLVSRSDVRR